MIPVPNPIPEPNDFDSRCRIRGKAWLGANPIKRPKDYWSTFRHALAAGFTDRCGYCAMWISSGTVDHFVSCNEDRQQAYEWSNYRYVEGWFNSSKSKRLSSQLLDPFDERVLRQRRAWLEAYEQGAPLHIIEEKAPLIAAAIRRQNWPQR